MAWQQICLWKQGAERIYEISSYPLHDVVEYAKMKCTRLLSEMSTKLLIKLVITLLVLLIAVPIIGVGCQEEGQFPAPPSTSELSSTLVPNTDLDVYIYAKQDSPTTIPAKMVDAPVNIKVESFALWGVPAEDEFALGMGLVLTSASDASKIYAEINLEEDSWKVLSGNTIFLVYGSGTAAESLKTAISNNDFKPYDDSESLKAAATLPSGGITKLAAIALARPSKALVGFLTKDADREALDMINLVLKLVNLEVIAAGLYSPHQIDIAKVVGMIESKGSISSLDLGLLVLVKSGLPGIIVEPTIKKLLTEQEFTEVNLGGVTLYKRSWDTDAGEAIPVLVRIEGNYIFAAVAGQESYAETLITSVNR